jgi:RNA 2',3'-cyclic 3'-phosphodiesterase
VFLGAVPASDAERLGAAVATCAAGPVPVELGAPLWLAPRRPHVLTVGLRDPSGALAALQGRVAAALGRGPDDRPWLPHVTVARVRRGARIRPSAVTLPAVPARDGFGLTSVALVRSVTGASSRYEDVVSAPLA